MLTAPLPPDESERLEALRHYGVLDTPPEEAFDTLVALAADLLEAPIALVTFVDEERQWFKASFGAEVKETTRDTAFCAHTILHSEVMVVPNASLDDRFHDNPHVTEGMGIRFYAGAPLITPAGRRLGSLCVIDTEPRRGLSSARVRTLQRLAQLVVDELELRRALQQAHEWRAKHQQVELMKRTVFDVIDVGLCVCDAGGRLVEVNDAYCGMFGYQAGELVGQSFAKVVPPRELDRVLAEHREVIGGKPVPAQESSGRHKDGYDIPLWVSSKRIIAPDGRPYRVTSLTDISVVASLHEQLEHMAYHDSLTHLPNRAFMKRLFAEWAKRAEDAEAFAAVVQLDLDNFKMVNDARGHAAGDRILVEVSNRLRQVVRDGDIVTRWAGDEFFVVATGLERAEQAQGVAARVQQVFEQPFWLDGCPIVIGASLGVTVLPARCLDEVESLRQADLALYQAKETRNSIAFFTPELHARFIERYSLEQELQEAIASAAFELYYQPRVDLKTERLLGVEALLRWPHPTRGMVSPGVFIPLAEESNLILELGALALNLACQQAAQWLLAGTPVRVAVNISAKELLQSDFVDKVVCTLKRHGLPPNLLELELTERAFVADAASCMAKLRELQSCGVVIAMDDFGTGYSSLSALTQLPLDVLKLDKSFVDRVSRDMTPQDRSVLEAVIALARSLGLELLAEGVETLEQQQVLLEMGCEQAQGYLLGRPAPVAALSPWLVELAPRAACAG